MFFRQQGAPLDNNVCERALKMAISQRRNSLFDRTRHGASVGDMFTSLIHTAELRGQNPFDYPKSSATLGRLPTIRRTGCPGRTEPRGSVGRDAE